jgi:hypothetical protein
METLGQILEGVGSLGSLICLIIIWVKMFQNGNTGLGIACILLTCLCVGPLITYIFGWIKAGEWNSRQIMLIWTVCIILSIVGSLMAPVDVNQFQQQLPH